MSHERILSFFNAAVKHVAGRIQSFVYKPGHDFTREGKLPAEKMLSFLVSQGSSSTKNELNQAFSFSESRPSESAFVQKRAKLKPEAFEEVFRHFNHSLDTLRPSGSYRFLAADGTTVSYLSKPSFSPPEYHTNRGDSEKGCYSMHINALYDLDSNRYTDALIQPIRHQDEFAAFCSMVDRHPVPDNTALVFIGDRGYCSYNTMAHVIQKKQFFLFRAKDIASKGLLHHIDFPNTDTFDVPVKLILTRKQSKKMALPDGYVRYISKDTSFDFLEYGSSDFFELSFRVVRLKLSKDNADSKKSDTHDAEKSQFNDSMPPYTIDAKNHDTIASPNSESLQGSYEALITNLPLDDFPPDRLKELYNRRWGIESSFRDLKYSIGLTRFHASKPLFIQQEIWARLISYNFTSAIVSFVHIPDTDLKYAYKVNFSAAASICRNFLRSPSSSPVLLLARELIPIRPDRSFPRLKTAHFRRPAYFIYRPA